MEKSHLVQRMYIGSTDSPVTPKLIATYPSFKLISQTSSYQILEAFLPNTNQKHTIRALDIHSKFVQQYWNIAATLFIQELLRLVYIQPEAVLIESFEICNERMAFASLPYEPLRCESQNHAELNGGMNEMIEGEGVGPDYNMEKMIIDLLSDIEFLMKDLRANSCSKLLTPQNIFRFDSSSTYFVGDWIRSFDLETNFASEPNAQINMVALQSNQTRSDMSEEIYNLGMFMLQLCGLSKQEHDDLRKIKETNSKFYTGALKEILTNDVKQPEQVKRTLERMLSVNPKNRPNLEEIKLRGEASNYSQTHSQAPSLQRQRESSPQVLSTKSSTLRQGIQSLSVFS